MIFEVVAALFLGVLVVGLILEPLYRPGAGQPAWEEPEDPEETKRGIALIALKEIDFDLATGKLSDADHQQLKARYAREAIEAIKEEEAAAPGPALPPGDDRIERMIAGRVALLERAAAEPGPAGVQHCPNCGPRPEPDALFCSFCGASLQGGAACPSCRASLDPGSRFCGNCGVPVADLEPAAQA